MKKLISILLVVVTMFSIFVAAVPTAFAVTYSVCTDDDGKALDAKFINNISWVEENGILKPVAGSAFNFLLFDDALDSNRIEATFVINDNGAWDGDHKNGIVFAFTDHDGDLTTTDAIWNANDISYYWAFINDWGCVQVMEMGKYQNWVSLSTKSTDLSSLGINVKEGVTLAAEWDNEGHIKIYANGTLVQNLTDETPLTGNMYGIYEFAWGNLENPRRFDTSVTSFVAGTDLEWAEYVFVVDASATEGGAVSGTGEYDFGEKVTLTATPETGYRFTGWTENGELISVEETFTFTADKNHTFVANFVSEFVLGDANGDGRINMKDIVLLRQYISNTSSVKVGGGADANRDGEINSEDVIFIRNYISNYDYDAEKEEKPKKYVAFTFDDGPSSDVTLTQKYVYELAKYGGKATLFLVGQNITPTTSSGFLYAAENGWEIGIHGYSHVGYGADCSDSTYEAEVSKTADAIHQYLPDYEITLLRPPYAAITADRIAASPYSTILWSLSSEDWRYYGGATEAERNELVQIIIDNVMNGIKDGDIILMHEPNSNTLTAFRELLRILDEQGYEFVTVSELLGNKLEAGKVYYSGN